MEWNVELLVLWNRKRIKNWEGGSNSLLVIFYGFYSFAPMCNGCSDWSVYNKQRSGPFVDDLNNSWQIQVISHSKICFRILSAWSKQTKTLGVKNSCLFFPKTLLQSNMTYFLSNVANVVTVRVYPWSPPPPSGDTWNRYTMYGSP